MPTSAAASLDFPQHRVVHGLTARGLLERGGVEVGDPVEIVLAPRELARRRAHRRSRTSGRESEQLERRLERRPPRASSTGTLSATSSGSSENQPTSLTTSGLPSESERMTLPEVSPIVG